MPIIFVAVFWFLGACFCWLIGVSIFGGSKKDVPYNPTPNWNGGFATDAEIEAAGAFENKSDIIIGTSWQTDRTIYHNPKPGMHRPMLQFGGMGSFKTSAVHIPLAFLWKWSAIIFEATCETALTTAHYRLRYGDVYIINATGAYREQFKGLKEARINTHGLYWLNPSDTYKFGVRCRQAACFAIPDMQSRDKYWDMSGQDIYETVLRTEIDLNPGKVSIGRIARIFRGNLKRYLEAASVRVRNRQLRSEIYRLLAAKEVKSIQEVIQNICTHLAPYREPRIAEIFGHDDVRFGDARKRVMTIIWVNELETMGAMDSPRRFALNCCLGELQSEQFAGDKPVAVFIDELPAYQDDKNIRTCMSTLRKFNCFPVAAINDYGTLEQLHGKAGANGFINSAGVVQWMQTKDQAGTEMLSKLLGEKEIFTEGMSLSNGGGRASINRNYGKQRRRLMEPWEIAQNLGPMDQIVFMDGVARPILCKKLPYFDKKSRLRKLGRRNPFAPKTA